MLGQQDLVEVVHHCVGAAIVVRPVGVVVDGTGRIELEAFDTLVHEVLQVVHPVLLTGSVAALTKGYQVLFH